MKADDIKRFLQIIQPAIPAIEAAGFHHYVNRIFRRVFSRHIYQDFLFAWPRDEKDDFNLYLEVGCPGDRMMEVIEGNAVNLPFLHLGVLDTFSCTKAGEVLMERCRIPPHSFECPFPYFSWFLIDTRPVWEEWFEKFTTPEALVNWCLEGGDDCGFKKYEVLAPVNYRKAAMILAYLGRNQEALRAIEEYHRLMYENKPGMLELSLKTNSRGYAYETQFIQDLRSGKHVIPAEYGQI